MSRSGDLLLLTARGRDRPGLSDAFLRRLSEQNCDLVEISQLTIRGVVIISFLVRVAENLRISELVKEFLLTASELGLTLETRELGISDQTAFSPSDTLKLHLVCTDPLASSLAVVAEVAEVVRRENINIESVQDDFLPEFGIRISFTLKSRDHRLTDLYVPVLYQKISEVTLPYRAFIALRPFDLHLAPQGRTLLVFGLTRCLVQNDVVAVTKEAQTRLAAAGNAEAEEVDLEVARALDFTRHAKTVCRYLRSLGFRLALVTSTASPGVASFVKQKLGLDYGLSTAAGGADEEKVLRKVDVLRLLQDREKVEQKNVVFVGDFSEYQRAHLNEVTGCAISTNEFPNNLMLLMYLLGFSPDNISELKQRVLQHNHPTVSNVLLGGYSPLRPLAAPALSESGASVPEALAAAVAAPVWHGETVVTFKVMGRDGPGQLARLLGVLRPFGESGETTLLEIFQSNVHGVLCLVLRLAVKDVATVCKELLFVAHQLNLQVESETEEAPMSPLTEERGRRMIVTMVAFPKLRTEEVQRLVQELSSLEVNIGNFRKLGGGAQHMTAVELAVTLPGKGELEGGELRERLISLRARGEVTADIGVQMDSVVRTARRMIVFDMDSTLIQQEVIDELGKLANVGEQIQTITEAAMRGEIDFFESLARRVALLKGHPAETLFAQVKKKIELTPGALQLCSHLKRLGFTMAVISGGFVPIAKYVQELLGLDYAFANELEVDKVTGLLTGRTVGPVVTPQRKKALLQMIAEVEGLLLPDDLDATIAVGDGANDIPMLQAAGLGVAFCAKPKVQQQTKFQINTPDLSAILYLLGLKQD